MRRTKKQWAKIFPQRTFQALPVTALRRMCCVIIKLSVAMTIELKPEQERILQEALREGRFQSVEQALDEALHSIVASGGVGPVLSPTERAAAFRSWAESHPRNTPVLSDEAISRETIYSHR